MPTALIAEDEPLLAEALRAELARAWPALQILATVGDGFAAVKQALQLRPEVLFFDIRMPGQSGLEAAAELADAWPQGAADPPFPALVFVTAYDQYAVQAFEAQALDYLLKPVQPARLEKTVGKLQRALAQPAHGAPQREATLDHTMAQLRQLLTATTLHVSAPTNSATGADLPPLRHLQVSLSAQIRLVHLDEIVYFEAADKYVRVLTEAQEFLIRTPLKELLPRLDAQAFWQVHRGTVVRVDAIDSVQRDTSGRLQLSLRGRPEKLTVSRLYGDLFRAM